MLPDGPPVQLTHDGGPKMYPTFSPDGSRIAYTVAGWDTWIVPVLARGEPRLMLPIPGVRMTQDWSVTPDGKLVGYRDIDQNLWVAPLDRRSPPRDLGLKGGRSIRFDSRGEISTQPKRADSSGFTA
jgi:WD40-like Beta Propeller Repeat